MQNEINTTVSKYITIQRDPEADYLGSAFKGHAAVVCDRIATAAESAGITVERHARSIGALDAIHEAYENATEIDWFTQYCSGGHRWNTAQWTAWFARQ